MRHFFKQFVDTLKKASKQTLTTPEHACGMQELTYMVVKMISSPPLKASSKPTSYIRKVGQYAISMQICSTRGNHMRKPVGFMAPCYGQPDPKVNAATLKNACKV